MPSCEDASRGPNMRAKKKVAGALRRYARSSAWVHWNKTAARMRAHEANMFLLGVIPNRNVPAERAWDAADWICSSIGDTDGVARFWQTVRDMEPARLRGFLRYGYSGQAFRHAIGTTRASPDCSPHRRASVDETKPDVHASYRRTPLPRVLSTRLAICRRASLLHSMRSHWRSARSGAHQAGRRVLSVLSEPSALG